MPQLNSFATRNPANEGYYDLCNIAVYKKVECLPQRFPAPESQRKSPAFWRTCRQFVGLLVSVQDCDAYKIAVLLVIVSLTAVVSVGDALSLHTVSSDLRAQAAHADKIDSVEANLWNSCNAFLACSSTAAISLAFSFAQVCL